MKLLITTMFILFATMLQAQQDTIQVDTITPTTYSQSALKELVTELEGIEKQRQELYTKVMLIVSAYIDPKLFAGITPDHKILKKK